MQSLKSLLLIADRCQLVHVPLNTEMLAMLRKSFKISSAFPNRLGTRLSQSESSIERESQVVAVQIRRNKNIKEKKKRKQGKKYENYLFQFAMATSSLHSAVSMNFLWCCFPPDTDTYVYYACYLWIRDALDLAFPLRFLEFSDLSAADYAGSVKSHSPRKNIINWWYGGFHGVLPTECKQLHGKQIKSRQKQ